MARRANAAASLVLMVAAVGVRGGPRRHGRPHRHGAVRKPRGALGHHSLPLLTRTEFEAKNRVHNAGDLRLAYAKA